LDEQRPTTEQATGELSLREALLPEKVRLLRQKLGQKAKQEKRFRFYSLYGLVSSAEVVAAAWAQVRAKGGTAGVDGISIKEIEQQGEASFLAEVRKELGSKSYQAGPVRRVYIPKANGKLRPLGIPNVKDRVVQCAVLLVLEPIFEADFEDCSYGFRPGRNAHQALEKIRQELAAGRCTIYDADLEGYFDSIPHDKLMACIRVRVVDGSLLRLIRMWLKAPVVEEGPGGKGKPTIKRNQKGTPQGGVISPLLANIYLHWFDRTFYRRDGPAQWAKATLVRYADDFVILARYQGERLQRFIETKLEGRLGLKINRDKTRIIDLREPGESLDFLGYSFAYERDQYGGQHRYWRLSPSKKALARERRRLREMTSKNQCAQPLPMLIEQINRHLKGWAIYSRKGHPRKAFRQINSYVRFRLSRHLRRRSQRPWRPPQGLTDYQHYKNLGLLYL
jgi:Retron-type reverse transcriptase